MLGLGVSLDDSVAILIDFTRKRVKVIDVAYGFRFIIFGLVVDRGGLMMCERKILQ